MDSSQRVFVDLPEKDRAVQLATYVATVRGEAVETSAIVAQAKEYAQADNMQALTNLVFNNVGSLLGGPDKEVEGIINLLLSLLVNLNNPAAYISQVLTAVSALEAPKAVTLKVLSNVYNNLQPHNPQRLQVYRTVVAVAAKSGRTSLLLPQLGNLDAWLKEWRASPQEGRALLLEVSEALRKGQHIDGVFGPCSTEAHDLLRKYLASFEAEAAASSADAKQAATRAVVEALNASGVFQFDELLALAAVQAVSTSVPSQLLHVLLNKGLPDTLNFIAANKDALVASGVDLEAATSKARLLAFAALGTENLAKEVSYAQAAAAMQVPEADVERWVIDAVRFNLVDVRMDQLNQTAFVARSSHRAFGPAEWQQLATRLQTWRQSVDGVLQVIKNAKLLTEQQQSLAT